MPDKTTIKIPKVLYESLKAQIADTGFSSVTDFIVYMLRNIAGSGSLNEDSILNEKEVEQVKARLKKLGYL